MLDVTTFINKDIFFHHTLERDRPGSDYTLHCHDVYEIYLITEGHIDYLIEGKRYSLSPQSLLLVRPGVLHGRKVPDNMAYQRYAVHFSASAIEERFRPMLLLPFHEKAALHYKNTSVFGLLSFFEALTLCSALPEDLQYEAACAGIQSLLFHICNMCRCNKSARPYQNPASTVSKIIAHLSGHFAEPVTLDRLSEQFYVSKHHLNKIFKEATGTTVMEYVIRKRIHKARTLMAQGQSAAEAAAESGFGDYSVFYKAFVRVCGHSPTGKTISDSVNMP